MQFATVADDKGPKRVADFHPEWTTAISTMYLKTATKASSNYLLPASSVAIVGGTVNISDDAMCHIRGPSHSHSGAIQGLAIAGQNDPNSQWEGLVTCYIAAPAIHTVLPPVVMLLFPASQVRNRSFSFFRYSLSAAIKPRNSGCLLFVHVLTKTPSFMLFLSKELKSCNSGFDDSMQGV